MAQGLKMILIAAGTVVTCILIVAGVELTRTGRGEVRKANEQYVSFVPESDVVLALDGRILSGQEVMDYMKLYSGASMYFQVKTNLSVGREGVFYNRTQDLKDEAGEYRKDAACQTDEDYINPNARFDCRVELNENEIPIGLKFIQRGD